MYIFAADAHLKAAITLVSELSKQIETVSNEEIMPSSIWLTFNAMSRTSKSIIENYLHEYLLNLMSTLLMLPDNPEQGVLYLFNGVLNIILSHLNWANTENKLTMLFNMFVLLSAFQQQTYIYNIPNGK